MLEKVLKVQRIIDRCEVQYEAKREDDCPRNFEPSGWYVHIEVIIAKY